MSSARDSKNCKCFPKVSSCYFTVLYYNISQYFITTFNSVYCKM